MGILHSVSALGVIIGYIFASIVINFFSEFLSWRFAIQIQGIFQIPVSIYFFFEKEEYINIDLNSREFEDELEMISEEENVGNINQDKNGDKINTNHIDNKKSKNISKEPKPNIKKYISHNQFNIKQEMKNNERGDKDIISNKGLSVNYDFEQNKKYMKKKNSYASYNSRKVKNPRMDAIETNNMRKYCGQIIDIICNPLYIAACLALCSIYFVLTGIQFWMTIYLTDILGNDPILVMVVVSFISITAPLGGVLVGGSFADAYGGYRGKNALKALKLCSAFGVIAFIFAFPLGFLYSLTYITVLLWAFLFFGAAIVPVSTGIMVSSVKINSQAASSSFSQLIFNLFGYFFSPILTGIIMDLFEDKVEGFKWG
jgi:hypothetical protein